MTDGPRAWLARAGLTPKKSFGQNFLTDARITDAIAHACVPDSERGVARVVEIGAGTGVLTERLLERAAHVTAIERDRDLLPILRERFAAAIDEGRLLLVEGDAATVDFESALGSAPPRVLAGNLPYQITGRLVERACHASSSLERAVFMVQREVADRLIAPAGSKDYGALTVFVQAAFDVDRVVLASRGAFFPQPAVDSAVVRFEPRAERIAETPAFRSLVKAAFAQRRKTLRNAWSSIGPREVVEAFASDAAISLDRRGETLTTGEFARASIAYCTHMGAPP